MNITPFFSIMMPTYNHQQYIGQAIESALNQTMENFELIICNDGSTDNTEDIIHQFKDQRIKYINKKNAGVTSALNACLMKSKGKYICWLSSDDIYDKNKLQAHFNYHSEISNTDLSIAPFGQIYDNKLIKKQQKKPNNSSALIEFLNGSFINGLSLCIHKDIYMKTGLFDERYKYSCDTAKWFQLLKTIPPIYLEGEPLSFSRKNTSSIEHATFYGHLDGLKMFLHQLFKHGFSAFIPNYASHDSDLFLSITVSLTSELNYFLRYGIVEIIWSFYSEYLNNNNLRSNYFEFLNKFEANMGENNEIINSQIYVTFKKYLVDHKSIGFNTSCPADIFLFIANNAPNEATKKLAIKYMQQDF